MKTLAFLFSTLILTSTVFASGQIDIAYSPYTISKPGSYLVVKDLTTKQNLDCIDINTSNVSIDLNGHTLYGAGTVGSSGTGINDLGNFDNDNSANIAIFNGTIRNFKSFGIYLYSLNAQVSRVNVFDNGSSGIFCEVGGTISDCNVSENGFYGIYCNAGIIRNNKVQYNGSYGIYGVNGIVISGNHLLFNESDGIYCRDATVSNNNSFYNSGNGITANYSVVENNNVENNVIQISASNSRISGNFCQIATGSNQGTGILVSGNNTIENNTLYSNLTGIFVTGTHNFIAGNRLTDNTVSISTAAGNTLGNGSTGFFNITY